MRKGVEREVVFKHGAQFFEDGGKVMFRFQTDASSVIGPREATKADKEAHAFEWEQFNAGRLPQLDRDGDGFPGGSLPSKEAERIEDAEAEAKAEAKPEPKRRGRPKKAV